MEQTLSVAIAFERNPGVSMPIVCVFHSSPGKFGKLFTSFQDLDSSHPKMEILHAMGQCICSSISRKIV